MALERRIATPILALSCLLAVASIALGRLTNTAIVTGNIVIESQVYTIYEEDMPHHLRVRLEGTHCFEALPSWVYPDRDATPVTTPTSDIGTFFTEMVSDVMDVLARCPQ